MTEQTTTADQIKNGELIEVTLTDGTTMHAEHVYVKTSGWVQVGNGNDGVPSHYPAHVVDEIHGKPVRYQSPHGRI